MNESKYLTTTQIATEAIRVEASWRFNELPANDRIDFCAFFNGGDLEVLGPIKVREAYNWIVRRLKRREREENKRG